MSRDPLASTREIINLIIEIGYPQENMKMIFKASFADGTAEIVHANRPADARYEAVKLFPGKLVVKVELAGLMDMANRRARSQLKTKPSTH
jgi:hypothetical protein